MNNTTSFLKNKFSKVLTNKSVVLSIGKLSDNYSKIFYELTSNLISINSNETCEFIKSTSSESVSFVKINDTNLKCLKDLSPLVLKNKPILLMKSLNTVTKQESDECFNLLNNLNYKIYDVSPFDDIEDCVGPISKEEFEYYSNRVCVDGNFLCLHSSDVKSYNLPEIIKGKTSVVITGRNDSYKENERFIINLNKMLETFDEVIYIDWNSDKGSMLYEIIDDIPKTKRLKHFIIEPEIVKILTKFDPKASACSNGLAANIAIRRTDAEYIVIAQMDIIPPNRKIFENFIKSTNKHTFYSLSRRDINYQDIISNKNNLDEYIDYLNVTSSPRYFPAKVTPNDVYSMFNCPGDFQFATKNVWLKLKGYEENMLYGCFADTNIQKKSILNNFDLVPVYDVPLYHMSHGGMSNDGLSPSKIYYNDAMEWVEYFDKYYSHGKYLISKNENTWGSSDVEIEYEVI